MVRNYIVGDVGGTHIRVACFPIDSQVPTTVKTIQTRGPGTPHDRLLNLIASIVPQDEEIAAISIAAPGPLDPFEGVIYNPPNISGWENLPLKKLIQDQFNVPVAIGNDANLAALGEWRFGAGKGHRHLVYITVSTGIGGGIIIDNQLLLGIHGLAAELGHITVLPDGPLCGCGQRGHLEAVSSGLAIAKWVEEELIRGAQSSLSLNNPFTAKDIANAAELGDELSRSALARSGMYLGIAIAGFLHVFNPTMVILGGGVSQSGDAFLTPLRGAMNDHAMSKKYLEGLTLTTSALGDEAGLMGALAMAQSLEEPSPCQ